METTLISSTEIVDGQEELFISKEDLVHMVRDLGHQRCEMVPNPKQSNFLGNWSYSFMSAIWSRNLELPLYSPKLKCKKQKIESKITRV